MPLHREDHDHRLVRGISMDHHTTETRVEAPRLQALFPGTSEVAALMRRTDRSATPLGGPTTWPKSLLTMLSMHLRSRYQMWLDWGPNLHFFYNVQKAWKSERYRKSPANVRVRASGASHASLRRIGHTHVCTTLTPCEEATPADTSSLHAEFDSDAQPCFERSALAMKSPSTRPSPRPV